MSILSINIYFLKHVELHTISLCKLLDLHIGAWLLVPKLVAGEGKNGQLNPSFLAVLLVQLYQLGIVDPGLPSFGGNIDQDTYLPLIFTEVDLLPVNILGREIVYRLG
eukprot:GFUD01095728.1.p1 GENE.GFUD01095728.1~~GFUD01095728.1.p1  ORF type:complete len:108 (-),score=12.44 GFUD01095728.1:167-490(-)